MQPYFALYEKPLPAEIVASVWELRDVPYNELTAEQAIHRRVYRAISLRATTEPRGGWMAKRAADLAQRTGHPWMYWDDFCASGVNSVTPFKAYF